ncbi:MAG: tyrosine--tRNA ligase [Candidatus Sungbacteria bacterium]|uniref:Tyrosine--tRNA ligase n=1 Tax=Candidatus Sungiibacteriota bacterium TaxID=2750080 RepID=A0A933DRU3_9BACT|nr:tyrosine--tRNA ligase [Candidatus Sungbacteria bacterium]
MAQHTKNALVLECGRFLWYGHGIMRAGDKKNFFSFLSARSAEIISEESLRRKLGAGRRMRVKLGIDPTTPHLHLGHVVPLRILRAFQDAGHHAVLIVGDFTGQIGDPSEKTATRRQLGAKETRANERTYRAQAARVLDMRRVEVRHNSEWFARMNVGSFLSLLANFSLKSAWGREDFQRRIRAGKEVRLHEAVYHVLQSYDSVMVRADVELGSLDQKLNILAGRELQKKLDRGHPPQDVVLLPYLIGLDGAQKMSKTAENTIDLDDSANEMFGKVMSIPDSLITHYARFAAWLPEKRIGALRADFKKGVNPRDLKLDLAEAVTVLYHGRRTGERARKDFLKLFSQRVVPPSVPTIRLAPRPYRPLELLAALKVAASTSEARRLLAGKAVEVDGRVLTPADRRIPLRRGSVIRIGKRRFFRVR